jgi:hypothetical protein
MDYGGRRLITDAIASRGVNVLLEIGSFLGGSARQRLATSREIVVVCVDPWPDLIDPGPGIAAHRIGRAYRDQLRASEGVYRSFISSMWEVRHRIVHVRGMALDVLPELHSLGLRPDMVYIDADKKGHEIPVCNELFLTPSSPGTIEFGAMDTRFRFGNLHPDRHAAEGVGSSASEPRG